MWAQQPTGPQAAFTCTWMVPLRQGGPLGLAPKVFTYHPHWMFQSDNGNLSFQVDTAWLENMFLPNVKWITVCSIKTFPLKSTPMASVASTSALRQGSLGTAQTCWPPPTTPSMTVAPRAGKALATPVPKAEREPLTSQSAKQTCRLCRSFPGSLSSCGFMDTLAVQTGGELH